MANFLKVVFLGLGFFALLVYLTAEKPAQIQNNNNVRNIIKYESLPQYYEIVGKDGLVSKETLLKRNKEAIIVVGNHDSLAVLKEFPKLFNFTKSYLMVANISSAPWFVKKMFIPSKLEEINQDSQIPMIYDFDGNTAKSLFVTDNSKIKFVAFLLTKEGTITKIYEGNVKEGALDGSMSKDEIKKSLLPLYNLIK